MKRFLTLYIFFVLFAAFSFTDPPRSKKEPDFVAIQNKWVDSVFNSLSPAERLGQLFMVAAYSNRDLKHAKEISDLVRKQHIGGLIWMQGGPVRQGRLANYYQSIAKTPLLYSIDGEWGLAMRLDSTPRYPKQMTLGAIQNDSLIYYMGRQIALECKRIGLHVNFAPVADVNNNPLNPVIGMRSFGENKYKVAQKAYMYMQGMQDEHVMANGKHFPGHGDTESDSHKTLPFIGHSVERLDSLELYPFRYLFERGLGSIMVAHLNIPSLDTTQNLPSTLSPKVVTDLLKNRMGFRGLIFTDALNMKGASKFFGPGLLDVKAILAGNDVLLFSENVPKAMEEINKAIAEGKISQEEIDERCKKILKAKYWCGLHNKQEIVTRNIYKELNTPESVLLNDRLAAGAITLLKNEGDFLPLKLRDTIKIAEVSLGVEDKNDLYNTLKDYAYVEHIGLSHKAKLADIAAAFEKISHNDIVVIQLNNATLKAENNYGMGTESLKIMDSIARLKPTVLVMLSNPYLLNKISSLANFKAVVLAYEYMPSLVKASANAMLGLSDVSGRLPVSTTHFKSETGIVLSASALPKLKSQAEDFKKKKNLAQ